MGKNTQASMISLGRCSGKENKEQTQRQMFTMEMQEKVFGYTVTSYDVANLWYQLNQIKR